MCTTCAYGYSALINDSMTSKVIEMFTIYNGKQQTDAVVLLLFYVVIHHKQNKSTEGCSKLKRSEDMTASVMNGLNNWTNASPKGTGSCVRRSKRPLLASRNNNKYYLESSRN